MTDMMILNLDVETISKIVRFTYKAPVPSHFESPPLKSGEIEVQATSFRKSCREVLKRLATLATTCHFFRIPAWESFIDLVALLSAKTSWTYSGDEQGSVESLNATAEVYCATVEWNFLVEGAGLWLKKMVEFFKRKENEELIKEQQVRIKKTELMLEEKEELIKGLKRELELALEELTFAKRKRK
jgi:hypothetical protein